MTNLGSLGVPPQLLSWVESLSTTPASFDEVIYNLQLISSPQDDTQIPIEKLVREEDILALMPPSMLQMANFQMLVQNFPEHFGIDRISSQIGATESALILAAATSWAQAQNKEAELVQEIIASEPKNSIPAILNSYITQSQAVGSEAIVLQGLFRKTPSITNLFHTTDPSLITKAYQIAEQQIVLSMLNKWVEMEAKRAKIAEKEMKLDAIQAQEIAYKILREYIQTLAVKKEIVTQPVLSILLSGMIVGTGHLSESGQLTLLPMIEDALSVLPSSSVENSVKTELVTLTSGLLTTVTNWATPVAMTILKNNNASGLLSLYYEKQISQSAAHSFALTLATFLTNPAVDKLLFSRLESASQKGLITTQNIERFIAALKVSLLMNTLALLYKAEYGGITVDELKAHFDGTFTPENDSYSAVIIKLISEQVQKLDPNKQAQFLSHVIAKYDSYDMTTNDALIEPIKSFISLWTNPELQKAFSILEKA